MNVPVQVRRPRARKSLTGFTLVEVLVTIVLVSVAVVGVLGGIRAIKTTDVKAQTADLLQRLASEKISDLKQLQDPSTGGTSGDFSDRGYPAITWSLQEDTTSVTNLSQITVTATQGRDSQALTTLLYLAPQTGTTTTGATGTTAAGA